MSGWDETFPVLGQECFCLHKHRAAGARVPLILHSSPGDAFFARIAASPSVFSSSPRQREVRPAPADEKSGRAPPTSRCCGEGAWSLLRGLAELREQSSQLQGRAPQLTWVAGVRHRSSSRLLMYSAGFGLGMHFRKTFVTGFRFPWISAAVLCSQPSHPVLQAALEAHVQAPGALKPPTAAVSGRGVRFGVLCLR